MSQQEDDLRALAKIMDFLRAVSIILVVMNVYWFCYEAIREFPEAREGRLAGDPFPPAGSAAAGEVCRLYEVHPADLSVDGRCACRKVPGKVPGTETDYITIQTLLEYASNDI